MTHGCEEGIMETTTTFGKQKLVAISRSLAFMLCLIFVACIVGTGLIVYNLSACSDLPKVEESVIVYNKYAELEGTTTVIVGTSEEIIDEESTTTEETQEEDEEIKLPKHVVPEMYQIRLIPFIFENNFTFLGQVEILVNVSDFSNNVTLHAANLSIDQITVREVVTKKLLTIRQVTSQVKNNFLIISLDENLEANLQYSVKIKYKGILNDLLQGFYRSSYKVNNETRWIAATQFQATDARKAFPCFDEPALKAKFKISLARLKNMTAISNMPKMGESEAVPGLEDYVWDHFQESVSMSTYLVAFIISDFQHFKNGTFAVWTRPSAISQTKYALQIGPQILQFYETFFGIKYPLPKMDMVGLPDFSAGAMENWGLITYRESVLLYEEKVSSKMSLHTIAHVMAHELAHQWFGNLVTPVWWSDLWLNEGFATYMESLGANSVNPHLKELDQFLINELHPALILDSLKSSHQISMKVNNPDEINDIFDRISYSKGASILRMMQHFLTMPVFQKAITRYLKGHMYKNAEQDDLWHIITQQSHEDKVLEDDITIKEIMDTWTLQTGYPLVTAQRNHNIVTFTQSRFLVNKEDQEMESVLWWIPVTYFGPEKNLKSIWMKKQPVQNVTLVEEQWFLVNINQTGFYRVNYDTKNWQLLIQQMLKPKGHLIFDPKNRAQLLDDSLSLANGGYLDYEIALNLTKYLKQEREYVPWKAAITNLDFMYEMFVRTAHFDKFKNYLLDLLQDFYKEIGFEEKETDSQLLIFSREEITARICKLGVRNCVVNSVREFQTWKNSPDPDKHNSISVNMRPIVYCTAISVGGQEEWDFAWQRYLNANVESEKETLLMALGCAKEVWLLSRYLEWAITDNSGIRKHDTARVFVAVSNNVIGQQLAYRFVKTQWDRLRTYLGVSSTSLSIIIKSCTVKFNTQLEVDDFKTFLKNRTKDFGIALRSAHQSIEKGEAQVKWMNRNSENIIKWLSTNI